MKEASELDYLKWFAANADFGPADGDVRDDLKNRFVKETGQRVPKGWDENALSRPKCNPDLLPLLKDSALLTTCERYLDEEENGDCDTDTKHYIFEEVMNLIYSKDVWDYLKSLRN